MRTWRRLAAQGELGRVRHLADRAEIFNRGDDVDAVYFLVNGFVEIVQPLESGESLVVRVLRAPCLFGVLEACAGRPMFLESMRVLAGASVYRIVLPRLYKLLRDHPQATTECLAGTCEAFCRVAETEGSRTAPTVTLLAGLLLLYANLLGEQIPQGILIRVKRTQGELAAAVGASERQIQRIMREWREAGWLAKREGRWVLTALESLRQLSGTLENGLLHDSASMPAWVEERQRRAGFPAAPTRG